LLPNSSRADEVPVVSKRFQKGALAGGTEYMVECGSIFFFEDFVAPFFEDTETGHRLYVRDLPRSIESCENQVNYEALVAKVAPFKALASSGKNQKGLSDHGLN